MLEKSNAGELTVLLSYTSFRGGERGGFLEGVLRVLRALSLHGLPFAKALLLLFAEFMYTKVVACFD